MDARSPRWRQITPSQFAWEADALDFVRERLPDRDPYRAWANFEFTSGEGRVYEVDLLVFTPNGTFLVEIKSRPGTVSGDSATWRWSSERGGTFAVDNPLRLANYKAKVLKSLIQATPVWRQRRGGDFFIEALVFHSAPDLTTRLSPDGRPNVVVRDRGEGDTSGGVGVKGIDEFFRTYIAPHRHGRAGSDSSRALADALEAAGVRESQRSRQVGRWVIDPEAIDEGHDFQDFVGRHGLNDRVLRRIRIFPTPANMARDRRAKLVKAVQREFELLNGLHHPAIDVPNDLERLGHIALVADWFELVSPDGLALPTSNANSGEAVMCTISSRFILQLPSCRSPSQACGRSRGGRPRVGRPDVTAWPRRRSGRGNALQWEGPRCCATAAPTSRDYQ